jgi:hypothetical protein
MQLQSNVSLTEVAMTISDTILLGFIVHVVCREGRYGSKPFQYDDKDHFGRCTERQGKAPQSLADSEHDCLFLVVKISSFVSSTVVLPCSQRDGSGFAAPMLFGASPRLSVGRMRQCVHLRVFSACCLTGFLYQ